MRYREHFTTRFGRARIYGFLIKAFKFILFFTLLWRNQKRKEMKNYWQTLEIEFFWEGRKEKKRFDCSTDATLDLNFYYNWLSSALLLKSSALSGENRRVADDVDRAENPPDLDGLGLQVNLRLLIFCTSPRHSCHDALALIVRNWIIYIVISPFRLVQLLISLRTIEWVLAFFRSSFILIRQRGQTATQIAAEWDALPIVRRKLNKLRAQIRLVMLRAAVNQLLMPTSAYPTLLLSLTFSIFNYDRSSTRMIIQLRFCKKTERNRGRSKRKTWVLVKLRPRLTLPAAISRNQWFGSLEAISISGF